VNKFLPRSVSINRDLSTSLTSPSNLSEGSYQLLTDQHSKVTLNKLQHLSTQEHDNKLFFFANISPKDFISQDYLSLKLNFFNKSFLTLANLVQ
jgi:hypothetical protein